MAKRIRIIYKIPKPTFIEQLEDRARNLCRDKNRRDPILAGLLDEVAFLTDRLDRVRQLHKSLRLNLLRLECYIDTEIMQRDPPRGPFFYDRRLPERDMLRARLLKIEAERRQIVISEEERLLAVHERLFVLMRQHSYLKPNLGENGD